MNLDDQQLDKLKAIAELIAAELSLKLTAICRSDIKVSFLNTVDSLISNEKISVGENSLLLTTNFQKENLDLMALIFSEQALITLKDSAKNEDPLEQFFQDTFTAAYTAILEKLSTINSEFNLVLDETKVRKLDTSDESSQEFKEPINQAVAIEFKIENSTELTSNLHLEISNSLFELLASDLSSLFTIAEEGSKIINSNRDYDSDINPKRNFGFLKDINLDLIVELGRTQMSMKDVLKLTKGSAIELDRQSSQSVDLYVHNQLVAKGEIVAVDDCFGLRITEILGKLDNVVFK